MTNKTGYMYIIEDRDEIFIEGTRVTVGHIIRSLDFGKKSSTLDIEAIVSMYSPGYLTPAKLYSALAYFYDNKEKVISSLREGVPEGFVLDKKGSYVLR